MRLLLTIPDYWPHVIRGSERIVRDLGVTLAGRGHRVKVATRAPLGGASSGMIDGVDVHFWHRLGRVEKPLGWEEMDAFAMTAALAGLVNAADVYHAFYLTDGYGLSRIKGLTGTPLILSLHGVPGRRWWEEHNPRAHAWFLKTLDRAERVTVMAEMSARRMREDYGYEPVVLAPGLFVEEYARPRRSPRAPVIVCAAALDDGRKRLNLLVDAFALVARDDHDVELLLVGPGEDKYVRAHIDATAPELAGRITLMPGTDDMPGLLSRCTVGALASFEEAFGMVVLEYMAAGLPAVVADDGGSAELITEASGVAFKAGDAEACARALRRALDMSGAAGTEAACRARAAEYDWSERVRAYEALYGEVTRA